MTKDEAKSVIVAAARVVGMPKALDAAEKSWHEVVHIWHDASIRPLPESAQNIADAIAELKGELN